jgi:uncharacterized protein YdhG (YjbR/CyaY superfamily)
MKKVCPNGHTFEKSSDCPVCPVCEKAKRQNAEFPKMGAPAQRALANAGITTLGDLARWCEVDVIALHGMGPKAMRVLEVAMKQHKITFITNANETKTSRPKDKLVKEKAPDGGTVSEYLAAVPPPMRKALAAMRATIREAAPKAEEKISYGIPTYKLNGPLIHWAAFKNHASLIGVDKGLLEHFASELKPFQTAGSTIRFTAEKPLPAALVKKIVKYRVAQNLQETKVREFMKSSKKKMELRNE